MCARVWWVVDLGGRGGGGKGQCESGLRKYDHRFGALPHQTGFSDLC